MESNQGKRKNIRPDRLPILLLIDKAGFMEVQIDDKTYTYKIDGAHLDSLWKQWLRFPWKAFNKLKSIGQLVETST